MVFIVKSGTFQATQKHLNHISTRPNHPSNKNTSNQFVKKPKQLMLLEQGQIFGEESNLHRQDDDSY
jgi:hypothetical protein